MILRGLETVTRYVIPLLVNSAHAAEGRGKSVRASREIPVGDSSSQDVQELIGKVNGLVGELKELTTNIKHALNPADLKKTITQLNLTLENAAKTLSPEGGLTSTAQRALEKLEDSFEQLRQIITRINQGKGSVGMIINDSSFAEELREAMQNINRMLSKVGGMRFIMNLGGSRLDAYNGSRGWFQLAIWPRSSRYYLLGITVDPRGKLTATTTKTTVGTTSTTTETLKIEDGGLLITAMIGKIFFKRIDLSIGVTHGDTTLETKLFLGLNGDETRLQIINDFYSHSDGFNSTSFHDRIAVLAFPLRNELFKTLYVRAGLETFRKVNGKLAYEFGAGLSFDDNDVKILFTFL